MDLKTNVNSSFASRVSAWVIGLSGLIFLLAASVSFYYLTNTIETSSEENATLTMDYVRLEVDKRLSAIARTTDNLALIIQNADIPTDSLYSAVRFIVANNPDIVGSAIAFEPNHFEEEGYYFSPYAYCSGDTILTKQLGNLNYDYFTMEWYYDAKLKDEGNWTNPYIDEGGGEMAMSTYSSIMRNRQGEFIGVVTADISLDWLKELVSLMKPYPNSYAFALDTSGSFIVHDSHTYSPYNTIFTVAKGSDNEDLKVALGRKMLAGETGSMDIPDNMGHPSRAFFCPIPMTGWSLAMVSTKADIFRAVKASSRLILIITILGLILLFFATNLIIKHLVKPLHSFAASAQKIAKGDFEVELPKVTSKDEMLELYNSFDYMKTELVTYMNSLASTVAVKERIESELRIARSIQMGLVPKSFPPYPSRKDIDIYAVLRTAKEVGGDLYDFFIENNNLYFTIGDVSDKGIPAALFMAVARSHFRSIAASLHEPKAIVESLNQLMTENNDENMFVTMIVGVLDLSTGRIDYCNAGHNNPCIIDANGGSVFMSMHPSLPIGILSGAEYTSESCSLRSGETIFLYTDGLNEAENLEKKRYGDDRLIRVSTSDHSLTAKDLVLKMLSSVEEYADGARQSDDITMLAIKYMGTEPEIKSKVLKMKNDVSEIDRMAEWLDAVCEEEELEAALSMPLHLALEEAVVNVINYAYPKDGHDYYFTLSFSRTSKEITFQIVDRGMPFNPLEAKDADITLSVEDRPIGGLGIHLVKQLMSSVEYSFEGGANKLTLRKTLAK